MVASSEIEPFLSKHGLSPPEPITLLLAPQLSTFLLDTADQNAARSLLLEQRTGDPNYRPPCQKKRHRFRTQKQKDAVRNKENQVFTKHEVAKAFDSLVSCTSKASAGVARALLAYAPSTSVQDLWYHLQDPELEKKTRKRPGGNDTMFSNLSEFTWLDKVTHQDDLNYISLLCQSLLRQSILNRAFGIALEMHSMSSMEILLSFGAVATTNQDTIKRHVQLGDICLVRLLLSASKSMDAESWRHCIEPVIMKTEPLSEDFANIVMCYYTSSHIRYSISSIFLLGALSLQNLETAVIILAYTGSCWEIPERDRACELVTRIQNHERRLAFFALLAEAGIIADSHILQAELVRDAESGHIELVKLLVSAGVAPDPHRTLYRAISSLNYDMLGALKDGHFNTPISEALRHIPNNISEPDMILLINILGPMGVNGNTLDCSLTQAVYKKYKELVRTLLVHGASIEFASASAVQIAIRNADFDILSTLLHEDCSPKILSMVIPVAMRLPSRPDRLRAMKALLHKGVQRKMLGGPLQFLGSEEGEMDAELIRSLVEYRAPLDNAKPILTAVKTGSMEVLTLLCNARPRSEILALAVPFAFNAIQLLPYDVALDMIKLLLQKGASGPLIDETLFQAVLRDKNLHAVKILLNNGADANYHTGISYVVAIERKDFKMLDILCAKCAPNQHSMALLLTKAFDPAHYDPKILELILQFPSLSQAMSSASYDIHRLQDHPYLSDIVIRLLRHDLSVVIWGRTLLIFAIRAKDVNLLSTILCKGPSNEAMRGAFEEVRGVESGVLKLKMMDLLLARAALDENNEIGQTEALIHETKAALDGDLTGLLLLLRYKAVVDCAEGKALQIASTAASFEVMEVLLSAGAACKTVVSAFIAVTLADIKPDKRHGVFSRLLNANSEIPDTWMTKALFDAVATCPSYTELPQLIVAHGAKANFEILQMALFISSKEVFEIITSSIADPNLATRALKQVWRMNITPTRKNWVISALLEKGIDEDEVSEALVKSLEADPYNLDTPKLLLEHGAAVNKYHAISFEIALNAKNFQGFKLLCQYLIDEDTANRVFRLVGQNSLLEQDELHEPYSSCLPRWPIAQSLLHDALMDSVLYTNKPGVVSKTTELLLQSGADPNRHHARIFDLMCSKNHVGVFRALCQYADLEVVLPMLLDRFPSAKFWIRECLKKTPRWTKKTDCKGILFQCIQRFPESVEPLKMLLNHGVPLSVKRNMSLRKGWPVESCTVLLSAMFSLPQPADIVIACLLAQGKEACIEYSTPHTKITSVFGCLIDKSRTHLLKYFLESGEPDILSHTISGSTFVKLASNSDQQPKEGLGALFGEEDEISPLEASLFLGNFEAFRLMGGGKTPDDGTLHLAALLALPEFVLYLLDACGHDPNYEAESFGFKVPLGIACSSQSFPWCKIANEETDWSERLVSTVRALAPYTDMNWRLARKTLLHIALENGLEATEAMAKALDASDDPRVDKKLLYKDRAGTSYTPIQYIRTLLEASRKEKKELEKCLRRYCIDCDLDDRNSDKSDSDESDLDKSDPNDHDLDENDLKDSDLDGRVPDYSDDDWWS